jgi:hypothetical protein
VVWGMFCSWVANGRDNGCHIRSVPELRGLVVQSHPGQVMPPSLVRVNPPPLFTLSVPLYHSSYSSV